MTQYLHGVKIGVLVDYEGDEAVGKDLAMHIAFSKPLFLSKDQVDPAVVAKERAILTARANESGKPAEIIAKMVEGGINKYLAEITLLGQPFVKDDKQTVEKMIASRKAKLHGYKFFVVGEGIERPGWTSRPKCAGRTRDTTHAMPPTSASCSSCRAKR